jgi:hypothetical protein
LFLILWGWEGEVEGMTNSVPYPPPKKKKKTTHFSILRRFSFFVFVRGAEIEKKKLFTQIMF